MKFVCYSDWDQLPDSANNLFAQTEQDNIFFSRQWFENVAAAMVDDEHALVLACVVSDNDVLAILPLLKSGGKTWYALKHRYTPHYSLLLADAEQQQVLGCLVQGLNQLPMDGLLLEPVADDDRNLDRFQRAMQSTGFSCEHLFRHYNWIYRVQQPSYQDYMVARPAKLRNTIDRKKRKLEREHGYETRLFSGNEVPQAMHDYYAVYNASWKANEQYTGFLDGIVASFSRPGWSRLGVLYIRGRPAAAQLWFVNHGKASIFRLAYDEAWKQYSPGSILTSFLMQHVIDTDKVQEIDFLTGNEAYKQDWMSHRRQRFALSCVKTTKPAGSYERFIKSLRRVFKK
jgi:hypothetical protein